MGYFYDLKTMYGGGDIGFYIPAFKTDKSLLVAHTQEECVIRITGDANTKTATLTVQIYTQYGLSGQEMSQVDVSLETSLTQYVDITDVLRSGLLRNVATGVFVDTATPCRVRIEEFDANGNSLGYQSDTISAYDSCRVLTDKFAVMLPDTLRMLASASVAYRPVTVRALKGFYLMAETNVGGTDIDSYTGTNGDDFAVQIGISTSGAIVQVKSDYETVVSRIVWESCDSDHVQLRWWSPVAGGWKSCAVKIREGGYEIGDKTEYVTMFEGYGAKTGTHVLRCVIENCSPRDVLYYSDLYMSDQVEMRMSSFNNYDMRVTVDGTPPVYGRNGYADMEFTITLEDISTLC